MLSTIRDFHIDTPIIIIRDMFLLCYRICGQTEEDCGGMARLDRLACCRGAVLSLA